jgi:transmembrane sensor
MSVALPDREELDAIRRTAAGWFARMLRDGEQADRAELERWLDQDVRHRRAYDQIVRRWQDARQLRHDPALAELRREALAAGSPRHASAVRRLVPIAASLLVAALVGIAGWALIDGPSGPYRTAIGERRDIVLEDGSVITLNTESRVRVAYTAARRDVVLEQGQAQFEVAKDAARPFRVQAGKGEVVALGTRFDVRIRNRDEIVVTLIEGSIDVRLQSPDVPAPPAAAHLAAGEQISVKPGGLTEILHGKVNEVTAWRSGELAFDDQPLEDVVYEANRYTTSKIVIGDDRLKQMHVTGVFKAGRNDTLIQALVSSLQLRRTTNTTGDTVLLSN